MHPSSKIGQIDERGIVATHGRMWTSIIVVDGDVPLPGWKMLVADGALVIAADGGARHALAEGVVPSGVIGDLDSLSDIELDDLARQGVVIHRFDPVKDDTDFELAAKLLRDMAPPDISGTSPRVLVVGGSGGRIDHALGNFAVLCGPHLEAFAVTALMGDGIVQVVRPGRAVTLIGDPGDHASLIPFAGDCHRVTTRGLRYALDDAELSATRALGVSNVIEASDATVSIREGILLLVEPFGARRLLHGSTEVHR